MTTRRRLALIAAILVLLWPALARAQEATESAVKAALVFKFASFVEWPENAFPQPGSSFVIGVMGAPDVAADLELVARGRSVEGRPVAVRRVGEGESLAGVRVLFVGRAEAGRLPAIAKAARPQATLLVADTERGLELGAVINFVPVEGRVGFDVSVEAAERSGLRISSRMLGVARRVRGGTG